VRRLLVVLILILVALATWLLREGDGGLRRERHTAAPRDAASERSQTGGDTPAAAEKTARAIVEGVVTGPDGPLWGVSVRVFQTGSPTAFDEVGTNTEGAYRFDLATRPDGEEIDIAVHPAEDSDVVGERVEHVRIQPGARIRRDLALTAGIGVSGIARGHVGHGVELVAIPEERWLAHCAASPDGYPNAAAIKGEGFARAGPRFRFPKLPAGRFAIVARSADYAALDAPVVQAGDQDVEVLLTPIQRAVFRIWDAETLEFIEGARVTVEGFAPGTPLTTATSESTSIPARLRWDGFNRGQTRRLRITAPGYYDGTMDGKPRGRQLRVWARTVGLVPRREANFFIRLHGDGAASFAKSGIVSGSSEYGRRPLATRGDVRYLQFPILRRSASVLSIAVPARSWRILLVDERSTYTMVMPLTADVQQGAPFTLDIELPAPAEVTLDWSALGGLWGGGFDVIGRPLQWQRGQDGIYRLVQSDRVIGRSLEWRRGQDGIHRLVPSNIPWQRGQDGLPLRVQSDRTERTIRMPSVHAARPKRSAIRLLPGEWTVKWTAYVRGGSAKPVQGQQTLTLAAGETLTINLAR